MAVATVFMLKQLEIDSESSDEDELSSVQFYLPLALDQRPKKRHRQKQYVEQIAHQFRMDEFKTFFRVDRKTQCLLDSTVMVSIEKNITGITCRQSSGGRPQKSINERILMLLWYMASGDKYASIADRFGMSESTACVAIRRLLSFIHEFLLEMVVVWPTDQERIEMQGMYMELKSFPGVVGMIDGCHIQIQKPHIRGIDYYNRKEYYSVVLQAVVSEDLRFTDIYTGWPGKVHDARIFRNSPLMEKGQRMCGAGHLLGDSAYPNLPYLLTPFRDNGQLTQVQNRYNQVHSSIRVTVERAFGLLKGRFVRLQNIVQRDIETVISTIVTGCVLHNLCIINSDEIEDVLLEDLLQVPQCFPNQMEFDDNAQETGAQKRLNIARRLN